MRVINQPLTDTQKAAIDWWDNTLSINDMKAMIAKHSPGSSMTYVNQVVSQIEELYIKEKEWEFLLRCANALCETSMAMMSLLHQIHEEQKHNRHIDDCTYCAQYIQRATRNTEIIQSSPALVEDIRKLNQFKTKE